MKRKLISKFHLVLAFAGVLGFSSCLKDSRYVDFSKGNALVELPLAANQGTLQAQSFGISATPSTFQVAVNIASANPLSTAVNVTLSVDAAALTAYNTANGGTFTLLPTAAYSIASPTVTVPANQRLAYLTVSINSAVIDPTANYALPLTITDGGGQQISNYKTIIYAVSVKNKYDGIYNMKGFTLRAGDPVLTGNFKNSSQTLSTVGADAVIGLTQVWGDGSGVGGISPVKLTVNPSTLKVKASSAVNATLVEDPEYDNRYDPATKTFYVSFYWNAGKTSRDATDTLVYKGPR